MPPALSKKPVFLYTYKPCQEWFKNFSSSKLLVDYVCDMISLNKKYQAFLKEGKFLKEYSFNFQRKLGFNFQSFCQHKCGNTVATNGVRATPPTGSQSFLDESRARAHLFIATDSFWSSSLWNLGMGPVTDRFVVATLCLVALSMLSTNAIPPSENQHRILPASTQYLPRQDAVKSIGLWNILYNKWSLLKSHANKIHTTTTKTHSLELFRKSGFQPIFQIDGFDEKIVANERRSVNIPSRFKIYEAVPTSSNEWKWKYCGQQKYSLFWYLTLRTHTHMKSQLYIKIEIKARRGLNEY